MDPALVTGELDNGLRYIVLEHAVPPGRAVAWIHMHTGSLNETDPQRGIAHYLEHMAFNGSKNFAPGSLVPFFQSLGMTFGRDQNAFTNFDQTTFQLSLPDAEPRTLGQGLTFFSDVVGGLSLLPSEIDAERQIIQEERRRGLSGRQRTSFYVVEHMAPGSLYGERITIGKEETIDSVKQPDFQDYYGKYYCASNATLMVVADTDPAEVVKVIEQKFGDLPKRPRPTPQDIHVRACDKSFAIVTSDPEVRTEDVRIMRLEPARPPVTTVPLFRADLVETIAERALNRRLGNKVAAGGTSYLGARVSSGTDSGAVYTAEISGRAKPGKWKETLGEIALEMQRARDFGFSEREIGDAKKEIVSGAERAVETEATMPASALISRLNGAVSAGEPSMSPRQRLDLLNQLLPTITIEEVSKRFAQEFDPRAVAFVAVLPSSGSVPSESELLQAGLAALAVKPTPEVETAVATTLMTELPNPGKVAEMSEHESSHVWSGWLANNVRVHYRFMDEREHQASVRIDLVGGEMLETAENRGITSAATLAWAQPATQHLTSSDIRAIMTGKKVNVGGGGFGGGRRGGGGGGSTDSISLSISGSPEEFETGFQLAHLLLTEPKIEQASFDNYKTSSRERLLESLKNPMALGGRLAGAALYPDDAAKVQPVTVEQIDALTLPAAQAWLDRLIKESPIEVVIVGDVDREQVMGLVARYLGSLPPRPRTVEETIDTPTAQAFVMSAFYGADEADLADARAMSLAARILSTRMIKEVREDAQLVYSIGAGSRAGTTYPGFGVFSAAAPTEPAKAGPLVAKLDSMYEAFAKSGPSEEELDVAKKQFVNTFDEDVQDPAFWARRLQLMTFHGRKLDDILNETAAYEAMTTEEVRSVFAKYCKPENAITVVVKPAGPG
ncbi:MAG: insulinase family protein [Phycisphaerales bacterium]|nr:insulinase family protein [Phycisphaerales bacterium]